MNAPGSTNLFLAVALLAMTGWPQTIAAQTATAADDLDAQDPLAARQQIARDRMIQLEDRMYHLIEKLSTGEPDQAKRLEDALRRARELLIRRQMDEAADLLSRGELAAAADTEAAVIKGLEELLAILLAEADHSEQIKNETDRLRAFDEKLKELIDRQRQLHRQLASAPSSAELKAASAKQRDLQTDTGRLACRMKPHSPHETQPSDQTPNDTQPAPGAENVQQAEQHMNDAAGHLDARRTDRASADQLMALDRLEQARQQIQQTLDQLRHQQQDQILRNLESRFRAMLARQETVNARTADLDARGAAQWTHADELTLVGLASEENALANEAAEAHRLHDEEGTAVVFPLVVAELRDDLLHAAGHLRARDTGPHTARLQADILDLLKELLEAVRQNREPLNAGAGTGGSSTGGMAPSPPLLPPSAELKMLRSRQLRINRLTEELSADDASAGRDDQIRQLADRQKHLAETAKKMHEWIRRP